jgi:hypothetical protein
MVNDITNIDKTNVLPQMIEHKNVQDRNLHPCLRNVTRTNWLI